MAAPESPLVRRAEAKRAAVACTSALHHQVLDYKRKRLHELWACLEALLALTRRALAGEVSLVDPAEGEFAEAVSGHRGIEEFLTAAGWRPRTGPRGRVWVLPAGAQGPASGGGSGGGAGETAAAADESALGASLDVLLKGRELLKRKSEATGQSLRPPPDPAAQLAAAAEARARRERRQSNGQAGPGGSGGGGGFAELPWEQQLEAAQAAQRLARFQQMHEAAADYEARLAAHEASLEAEIQARERAQAEARLAALREARALREEQDAAYREALEADRRKASAGMAPAGGGGGGGNSGAGGDADGGGDRSAAPAGAGGGYRLGDSSSGGGGGGGGGQGPASGGSARQRGRAAAGSSGGGGAEEGVDAGPLSDDGIRRRLAQLPAEPGPGDPDALTLRVRLPSGPPRARRFRRRQPVSQALDWLACLAPAGGGGGGSGGWRLAAGPFSGAARPALFQDPSAALGDAAGEGVGDVLVFASPSGGARGG